MATMKYKMGDRFLRSYGTSMEEIMVVTETSNTNDPRYSDGKVTKSPEMVYGFTTYVDGVKIGRPVFHMREKYVDDYINRYIWKRL